MTNPRVPLQRSDGRAQWQNQRDTNRFIISACQCCHCVLIGPIARAAQQREICGPKKNRVHTRCFKIFSKEQSSSFRIEIYNHQPVTKLESLFLSKDGTLGIEPAQMKLVFIILTGRPNIKVKGSYLYLYMKPFLSSKR